MKSIRKKIFNVLQSESNTTIGKIYDVIMVICIIGSLVPLTFKEDYEILWIIDDICVTVFIIDYILRWLTADYYFNDKSIKSFLKYPFTPMAIIDLLSILPSLTILYNGFKVLRLTRLVRALRILRVFRLIRFSKNLRTIIAVIKKSKDKLILISVLAIAYIIVSALVIFTVEPETFNTFYDAIYWATVSLTTVGYGDLYPVSALGRFIAMCSSFVGIAIIALPASILTSDYISIVNEESSKKKAKRHTKTKQS